MHFNGNTPLKTFGGSIAQISPSAILKLSTFRAVVIRKKM